MEAFDPSAFEAALEPVGWIGRVVAIKETSSTNDDALRLGAEGAADGTVVAADVQTAGRGRLGRSWWSEPGTTLTASWIMRPREAPERWTLIPLACGVAAARAIVAVTGLKAVLKWPNDVLVGDRKIAGILVEARPPEFLVAGIGINVSCAIPKELAGGATSIEREGAVVPERARLLAAILGELGEVMRGGAIAGVYRSMCATLGREVRVERSGAPPLVGVAQDVDGFGALIVRTAEGDVAVPSGDVVHLRSTA